MIDHTNKSNAPFLRLFFHKTGRRDHKRIKANNARELVSEEVQVTSVLMDRVFDTREGGT